MAELLERVRPVAPAAQRALPVVPPLAGLLPGGLPRGSTVGVGGDIYLLLALVAGASAAGSWCALVGLPRLGVEAAAALGVEPERLVLVPHPGERWPTVVSTLLDGIDVVVVGLSRHLRPRAGDARRLSARARQRGATLVVVEGAGGAWPETPDLSLAVGVGMWEGLGRAHGHLLRRRVDVELTGRRVGRPRRTSLWLPSDSGQVEPADAPALCQLVPA